MANYGKDEIDRWFDYSYIASKRLVYIGSRTTIEDYESGTDCQMAEFFIKAITHLNRISSQPIVVHMNNLGGDFYHGMAMYDAIRMSPSHVYGVCWGYAMSMGSIIIQACDSRIVAPNCTFMIHDGEENISGHPKAVEAWAVQSQKTRQLMYRIYLERMKAAKPRTTLQKIEEMCTHDTILTAKEAVSYGLADWVMETLNDPYQYFATDTQNAKWKSGMELGKHEAVNEEKDSV